MVYTQSQPDDALFDVDDIKTHLRIDSTTEDDYLNGLIAAATAHAEQSMQCSLLQREITATYFSGETFNLPRGPVVSIESVTIGSNPVDPSTYTVESYGTLDLLRFNNGNIQPYPAPATMTVTYTAGYGDDPTDIPADILHVIKCHVGLLYENREVATDRTITPVPLISDFYRMHSREPVVG